jgi:hypothetical protein
MSRQTKAAEQTLRLQAEALKVQAVNLENALNVAERSAKAAEDSALSTKALAEIGQRPWVCLEKFEGLEVQTGDLAAFNVATPLTLRNRGLTAALDLRTECRFERFALPVDHGPFVPAPVGPSTTLGPAGVCRFGPLFVLVRNAPDGDEIRRGLSKLLLYGDCSYGDVFGERHHTQWCLEYHVGLKTFSAFKSELNVMT